MNSCDIGLIGLAVMGENLALNIEEHGFSICVYNRKSEKVTHFVEGRGKGKNIYAAYSLADLVAQLKTPRIVMMMIQAGAPVDDVIEQLIPLLAPGDVIIDGGNSHFPDTDRRTRYVESQGLRYIGTGVSGGELGARTGPSIMPGGSPAAWPLVRPILQAISAKVEDGLPCCEWVGSGGAGHFVKMVHNGIEYGDMQLICEAYQIMRDGLGMTPAEMRDVFDRWNNGALSSYLIEITRDILGYTEPDGGPLIDRILDAAGQKGTGKWTVNAALDEGVPLSLIAEAVFARCLSAAKEDRVAVSKILRGPAPRMEGDRQSMIDDLGAALFAAKIVSYAQGFALMRTASQRYGWDLQFGNIALLWRGGCIIRSAFLGDIKAAFDADPALQNLLLNDYFRQKIEAADGGWRRICAAALTHGIPAPAMTAALAWYDGYRCENLPANLLQAQRDYFGAHTYERTDRPRGEFFHTDWTGVGGDTASTVYNA